MKRQNQSTVCDNYLSLKRSGVVKTAPLFAVVDVLVQLLGEKKPNNCTAFIGGRTQVVIFGLKILENYKKSAFCVIFGDFLKENYNWLHLAPNNQGRLTQRQPRESTIAN